MTEKWITDTGLVSVLISLILGFRYNERFFSLAVILLILVILAPKLFYPIALMWLRMVEILGRIIPKIFFAAVFFLVIMPVGVIRRLVKGDTLMMSGWKNTETSFVDRNHLFSKGDVETIY